MKNLLIISPNFPPVNAAEMHRVRQSVGYFTEMGWVPTVVMVAPAFSEYPMDPLLVYTLPKELEIIEVDAFPTRWTRKVGLGSLAFRSLWFYLRKINVLLQQRKFDLIYFSTTMFPVLTLGAYWKKRFQIPYVIDMQDPWHSEYYRDKPKNERPPKYWLSYQMNKYLEPIAMKQVDGIIAVSDAYCQMLQDRYPNIIPNRCTVITFGAFQSDFDLLQPGNVENDFFQPDTKVINVVYVGVVGHIMQEAISYIMKALKMGLSYKPQLFGKIRMYFIGTNYAPKNPEKTVAPIAEKYGVADYVLEYPSRVSYFKALKLIQDADLLVMPGSDDPQYTASKLYPYILARKPLLAVFHEKSSVINILQRTNAGSVVPFSGLKDISYEVYEVWSRLLQKLPFTPMTDWLAFEPYTAREMAKKQIAFFDKILTSNISPITNE